MPSNGIIVLSYRWAPIEASTMLRFIEGSIEGLQSAEETEHVEEESCLNDSNNWVNLIKESIMEDSFKGRMSRHKSISLQIAEKLSKLESHETQRQTMGPEKQLLKKPHLKASKGCPFRWIHSYRRGGRTITSPRKGKIYPINIPTSEGKTENLRPLASGGSQKIEDQKNILSISPSQLGVSEPGPTEALVEPRMNRRLGSENKVAQTIIQEHCKPVQDLAKKKNPQVWNRAIKGFKSLIEAEIHDPKSISIQQLKSGLKDVLKHNGFPDDNVLGFFLYYLLHENQTSRPADIWILDSLITKDLEDGRNTGGGGEIAEILDNFKVDLFLETKTPDAIEDLVLETLLSKLVSPSLDDHRYLLKAGDELMQAPLEKEWRNKKVILLVDTKLSSLPENPNCPNLLMLSLQKNPRLRVIPDTFFDHMDHVTALNLSKTGIAYLPESLFKLRMLEQLILRHCERLTWLPSEIAKLKQLKFLDLHGTKIEQMPDETEELQSLQHLDLSFYGPVDDREYSMLPPQLISGGIISAIGSLNFLRIAVSPGDLRWDENVDAVITDVCKLKHLTALHFYFPRKENLQTFFEHRNWEDKVLEKFNFVVGRDVKRTVSRVPQTLEFEYNRSDRCLRIVNGDREVQIAVNHLLAFTTALYLDLHPTMQSLSEFGEENIRNLEFCIVRECPKIKTIINVHGHPEGPTFPCLQHLSFHCLERLEMVWEGKMAAGSFGALKFLHVQTCPKMKFLLTSSMSRYLSNLEEIVVQDCPAMETIISDDTEGSSTPFPKLKKLSLRHLRRLVRIWNGFWPPLEHLTVYSCPNLENLQMDEYLARSMKTIRAERKWWDNLKVKEQEFSWYWEIQSRFAPYSEQDFALL